MISPEDYPDPPHDGEWPTEFLIDRDYADTITSAWRRIRPDTTQLRRTGDLLHVKQSDQTRTYRLDHRLVATDHQVYLATERTT
ncbi:hypothetical protein GCM10023217_34180 [Gordonia alkaliphila]|uniref:Uncharacterized protein n=1 Tax=Gordonia alkaliphila TaxID=1053547 RepID=A0ABP8ZKV4_9ACTN